MNIDHTDIATEITDILEAAANAVATDMEVLEAEAAAPDAPKPPAMRILRIQDCASLSGRSTLTYHIGTSESNASEASEANASEASIPELHLRIFANTAKGFFCKDWISLTMLDLLLAEAQIFASSTVQRLFFEGKSVNTGGFVLAALRHEGLVRAIPGSLRSYERLEPAGWQQDIAALIEAGVSLSEAQKPTAAVVEKPTRPVARETKQATKESTKEATKKAAKKTPATCPA